MDRIPNGASAQMPVQPPANAPKHLQLATCCARPDVSAKTTSCFTKTNAFPLHSVLLRVKSAKDACPTKLERRKRESRTTSSEIFSLLEMRRTKLRKTTTKILNPQKHNNSRGNENEEKKRKKIQIICKLLLLKTRIPDELTLKTFQT